MKGIYKFLIASIVFFSATALAGKVVIFDHQSAVLKTKEAQNQIDSMQKQSEYARVKAQIDSFQTDLRDLSKEAETKGMTWSQTQQLEHRKKMEYIQADLQLAGKKIQAENQAVAQKIMQEMQPKLKKVLDQIIKSDNIDVILRREAVYYGDPVDITDKVTKALDKAGKK